MINYHKNQFRVPMAKIMVSQVGGRRQQTVPREAQKFLRESRENWYEPPLYILIAFVLFFIFICIFGQ